MNKKGTKALASATLMSLVLTTALATGNVKAAAGQVTRVGGTDRYETAAKVATANFADGSENVILVNGLSYADSVSASALAKTLNAPILLTTADTLNADAKDALNTLKPKNVYIVGGEAAVSKSVADSLSDYSVTRLSGANRYATNLAVANELVKNHGVSKDNLLVVTGQAYSDALSAAPVAAAKGEILLLSTNDKTAMGDTYDFAKDSNVTVIGTTNSVDAATYSSLNADKRVDGGANRFATNMNILDTFKDDLKADKLYVATAKPNADGANDTQFADALVASAIAGKYSAPLVLTNSDADTDTATNNAISYIGKTATKDTDLQVVGGTGVVSDKLVGKINDVVNPPVTELAISSVDYVNSKKLVINFNKAVDNTDVIEDDGARVAIYPASDALSTAKIQSTSISFSNDKKTATVVLNSPIETDTNYKLSLLDSSNLDLANAIVSYSGVLSKGIDIPTATVNNDQNKLLVTYAQKMDNSAIDYSNYTVYDSSNTEVPGAVTAGDWDDVTTKKAVKLDIASGKLKAGETYKVVAANVTDADGNELSEAQRTFTVVTPGISDAKPVLKVVKVTGSNTIDLTFSKDLKGTVDKDLITVKKPDGTKFTINNTAVNGKTLTLTTDDKFDTNKTYTVSLDANAVKNNTFVDAGNDSVTNYSVSTPKNVAVKSLDGKFVQDPDDSTKYDLVLTFDQPVKAFDVTDTNLIVNNLDGDAYKISTTASTDGTVKAETYTEDPTGKSLVVKDVKANLLKDGTGAGLSTDSGKSYKVTVAAGIITASPAATPSTVSLDATIDGIATAAPKIDTVTLKSAKEIDVDLKNTANASALTASDITVKGFIKSADGSISPKVQPLTGSSIKVSASGSTLTITPKDSTVVFATGLNIANDTDNVNVLKINKNTLKNASGSVQTADLTVDNTGNTPAGDDVVTDDAAPELVAAQTGSEVATSPNLILTYTENVKFKATTSDFKEATTQFDLKGSELNGTVIPISDAVPDLTKNTITLTFAPGAFIKDSDYSGATVSYTPNSNYKVQDGESNYATTVTLTGIFNDVH
ncbi:cell wall-binding repeat-containing protein [Clostridium tyrobutyricum]|uniref:cell wall-binding repeat-containing protein n=1 Tax=Clostridium tyrobutyricum TaxID=1519 RepID=UPI0018AAF45D|nr:cell wall-binding repeat-containing protein [Clostridium tyrobutyricum]